MRNLLIIAVVAMLSATAVAQPPLPWVANEDSVEIPVMMDIAPAATITLPVGCQILLTPAEGSAAFYGEADPQPIVTSNVRVHVKARLVPKNPNIQTSDDLWGVALQGQSWTDAKQNTPNWNLDPEFIAGAVEIPIAVYVESPDLTVRPPGVSQVATVTLTVTPY